MDSLRSFFSLLLLSFSALSGFSLIIKLKYYTTYSFDQYPNPIAIIPITLFLALTIILFLIFSNSNPNRPIYLVDFSCLKPPNSCQVPFTKFLQNASKIQCFNSESLTFMSKVLESSGQSQNTYLPQTLHHIPPKTHHKDAITEAQISLFTVMDQLLSKTNLSPQNVDVLIVNCSGFCPSPSLTSIIINKYAMKSHIKSFNLSGMGCSASAAAIDLARNLLKVNADSNAVVLSTEILSQGWYRGNEKSMLILNCLFRMGSAAILLTNKPKSKSKSKYSLVKAVRTQRAFDNESYLSAIREEDSQGNQGVTLRREILRVAGDTLKENVTRVGFWVLPVREKVRYVLSWGRVSPEFKSAVRHYCLPVSGGGVIREIGKGLGLGEREMESALMSLRRFGNQSSSSLWYELAYLEGKERVKQGDLVWFIGMGSGPKCTSLVWKCLRPVVGEAALGPWADSIHMYP